MQYLSVLIFLLLMSPVISQAQAQTTESGFKYEADEKERVIRPGKGQVFSQELVPVKEFHFVQFGVYPATEKVISKILAPKNVGQVWLILHEGTTIKGVKDGGDGAVYLVKPYATGERARQEVLEFQKRGIRCWYNPDLTGAAFTLMAVTQELAE